MVSHTTVQYFNHLAIQPPCADQHFTWPHSHPSLGTRLTPQKRGRRAWSHLREKVTTSGASSLMKDTPTLLVSVAWLTNLSHAIQTIALGFQGTSLRSETPLKQIQTASLANRRSHKRRQMMTSWSHKLPTVKSKLRPVALWHTCQLPFANLSGVFCPWSLNIHFWVNNSCVSTAAKVNEYKIVTRSRHWKSTAFPMNVTTLSLPPMFEERAWDWGYSHPVLTSTSLGHTATLCW